jgi:hypothetical protein
VQRLPPSVTRSSGVERSRADGRLNPGGQRA